MVKRLNFYGYANQNANRAGRRVQQPQLYNCMITLSYVDFVIEVYRDCYWITPHNYFYRFIPVGTTVQTLPRAPDFVWYGQFHPGYRVPLDYPCETYTLAYIPPVFLNSTKSTPIL